MPFLNSELNAAASYKSLKIVDGHIHAAGYNYRATLDDDSPVDRRNRRVRNGRPREPIYYSYNPPAKPESKAETPPESKPEPELTFEPDGPVWWNIEAPPYEQEEEDPRAVRAYQQWQARKPEGCPPGAFLRWLRQRPF